MADSPDRRPLAVLRGVLSITTVRPGTGSQQQALVLETGSASFTLIKLGGPSFGLPQEASLAGRNVEAKGYLLGNELRFTQLVPI